MFEFKNPIEKLPNGWNVLTIVYIEALDSFIGEFDDESRISFAFLPLSPVKKGDRIAIVKNFDHYVILQGAHLRLPSPRASP